MRARKGARAPASRGQARPGRAAARSRAELAQSGAAPLYSGPAATARPPVPLINLVADIHPSLSRSLRRSVGRPPARLPGGRPASERTDTRTDRRTVSQSARASKLPAARPRRRRRSPDDGPISCRLPWGKFRWFSYTRARALRSTRRAALPVVCRNWRRRRHSTRAAFGAAPAAYFDSRAAPT